MPEAGMKIQVNSDKTIDVDASLKRFAEDEVRRLLGRFAKRLTRVEIHLSDIDNKKTGKADKRCLVEVRPAGDRPMIAHATAANTESAVGEALKKTQRLLTTFFGRRGRPAVKVSAPVPTPRKGAAKKTISGTKKKAAGK
jgi:hypothetical protein